MSMKEFRVNFFCGSLNPTLDDGHKFLNRWTTKGRTFTCDEYDSNAAHMKARKIIKEELDSNTALRQLCLLKPRSYAVISCDGAALWLIPFSVASITRTEVTF